MTGTLAQLISLVSYGNEFLDTGIQPEKPMMSFRLHCMPL
jgi:hypothetical protein